MREGFLAYRPRTPTVLPARGDWLDYIIVEDGRDVGRIYENRHSKPEYRWFWSISVYVNPKLGITTSGRAPTLDEAKAQFLRNWQKCQAAAEEGPLSGVSYLNGSILRLAGPPCATRLQPNQKQSTQLRKLQASSTCLQITVSTCFAPVPPRADAPTARTHDGPGLATSTPQGQSAVAEDRSRNSTNPHSARLGVSFTQSYAGPK